MDPAHPDKDQPLKEDIRLLGRVLGDTVTEQEGDETFHAFRQERREDGLARLQEMHARWPYFRSLLSNMDMVLAKVDLAIASRYADLVGDPALRDRIFGRLQEECVASISALKAITGQADLLEENPALRRSIQHRFPYLDPLNHLQVELLRRYRAGDGHDRTARGILLTINGIAAGLRNSG